MQNTKSRLITGDATKGGQFLRGMRLETGIDQEGYPFDLPLVRWLSRQGGMNFDHGVTFLVGENGSGKSTLVESIAVAAGINAEGGSQNFRFASRPTESSLGSRVILRWGPRKPRSRFFLRAESYYNIATELERLDEEPGPPPLLPLYGGVSPHARSHGQSFLDLAIHRFRGYGFYLLDEPEAALSVRGCMALIARMHKLVSQGSQLLIATHSPILLAMPGATIIQIEEDGSCNRVGFDDSFPVVLTRQFLSAPEKFIRHLVEPGLDLS
jgi:predicted ATPase